MKTRSATSSGGRPWPRREKLMALLDSGGGQIFDCGARFRRQLAPPQTFQKAA